MQRDTFAEYRIHHNRTRLFESRSSQNLCLEKKKKTIENCLFVPINKILSTRILYNQKVH